MCATARRTSSRCSTSSAVTALSSCWSEPSITATSPRSRSSCGKRFGRRRFRAGFALRSRARASGRTADMAVRFMRVQLCPAHYHADKAPIDIWVIHAREENPPPNTEAVEWFLLTTIDLGSPEDAEQCLRWYCLRWRIEDWHRVLKSGCRIEDIAHETAGRVRRAIA